MRYGRRFTQLDAARRTRFLESLQDAPLPAAASRLLAFAQAYGAARRSSTRGLP